jgi:hypothetical protein
MIDITDITQRPAIAAEDKDKVRNAFLAVPDGKSSALIAIYDIGKKETRLHAAFKVNEVWKVGAQVGYAKGQISGFAAVQAAW